MVRLFFAILGICLLAGLAGPVRAQVMENNTDRPGATYKQTPLGKAGPDMCWNLCAHDENCKAWTWKRPGLAGPEAMCLLKTDVMPAQKSPCCVSGVSSRIEAQIDAAMARPENGDEVDWSARDLLGK